MYCDLKLFIGGKWRNTASDLPVVNPATEEEIGRLPCAGQNDLDDALEAAEDGLKIWSRTAPRDRSDIIMRAAALMRDRQEEIAKAITAEHGKPLPQARMEVIRGADDPTNVPGAPGRDYHDLLVSNKDMCDLLRLHGHTIKVVSYQDFATDR